jgi:hypothetical protein
VAEIDVTALAGWRLRGVRDDRLQRLPDRRHGREAAGVRGDPAAVDASLGSRSLRSEARAIEGHYGRGIVATKNIIDTDHPSWALPAPLVALLLH